MIQRVIVTGSVAYDYIMGFPGDFRDHILPEKLDVLSVSFLVDSLRREPGGCATNIAYTLALLGQRPSVMATVGHDYDERTRLEANGVDTGLIRAFPDEFTASFFVSTDQRGCQVASFYVGAMGRAQELSLDEAETDSACVVIAPNAPAAMSKTVAECKALRVPYIYDPSQQIVRLSADDLRAGIDGCHVLMANDYESALIYEKTGLGLDDLRAMCTTLIVTQGESGSRIYRDGGMLEVPAVAAERPVDPTGVGDAYRAGVLLGLLRDLPWDVSGRVGALCATYALEHLGTQRHSFTPGEFIARYASAFGTVPAVLETALLSNMADTPSASGPADAVPA